MAHSLRKWKGTGSGKKEGGKENTGIKKRWKHHKRRGKKRKGKGDREKGTHGKLCGIGRLRTKKFNP